MSELPSARTIPTGVIYEARGGPWVDYLERHPQLVARDRAVAQLTTGLWKAASIWNQLVNRTPWLGEPTDSWSHARLSDCEDFALEKRFRLAAYGQRLWPLGALRVMVGQQYRTLWGRRGEPHAVLNLVTDRGDFVANVPPFSTRILPIEEAIKSFRPWWRTADGCNVEQLLGALGRRP